MIRRFARMLGLLLALCALPALAQTRAWLDRAQITYGETATLNIETSASVRLIDYSPLAAQFDIAGQTVRRSYELVNERASTKSLFAVGIRPRGPGVIGVPALRVGNSSTPPLRLTVRPRGALLLRPVRGSRARRHRPPVSTVAWRAQWRRCVVRRWW